MKLQYLGEGTQYYGSWSDTETTLVTLWN
jgi:hypothetical protein